jgi:uncharacterized protein YlxW (UPF0749 family)
MSAPPGNERSRATGPKAPLTTAMLDDLLNNTLDPGYRAAAGMPPRRHWWDAPMVWAGCLLVGLLLVTAYQQSHLSAPARDAARKDLITRITNLQQAGSRMDGQAKQLAAEVNTLRDRQLSSQGDSSLRNLDVVSGGVAMRGPGVTIQVSEPAQPQATVGNGRAGTGSQPQAAVLHDRDIRAVVNQLWASGAEAIAVNGIRLTATTAIRFAGESILVDFQTISTPYTISAIGNRDTLLLDFADSPIARQLKTAQAVLGIGFKFSGKSVLTLPSVTVAQQSYASPGASPSPASKSSSSPSSTETSR